MALLLPHSYLHYHSPSHLLQNSPCVSLGRCVDISGNIRVLTNYLLLGVGWLPRWRMYEQEQSSISQHCDEYRT